MRRGALGLLVSLGTLAGCQTVSDKAGAEALDACSGKAEIEERMRCRDEIFAAADAAERERLEEARSRMLADEQREALRKAQGIPKKAR